MNKRGLSPIIATILLIAFAVAIGAMIMNWTAGIIEEAPSCADIPTEIINVDAFCRDGTSAFAPRVKDEEGKPAACLDHKIEVGSLAAC